MKISPAGIALIQRFEGCKLDAYPDASPERIPTIGYGHTGAGVFLGLKITQERANELLCADLVKFEAAVSSAVHVTLTQGQFDALVSFAYNVKGWRASTLINMVNAGNFASAAAEFPKWCHAGKTELAGLVLRRAAEQQLFLS